MLQYVTQLAFYVHMKLSGKKLEGHPVVESLVELRVVLEKMKPIESKLKYQIDKLIRAAVIGTQKQEDATKTDEITAVGNCCVYTFCTYIYILIHCFNDNCSQRSSCIQT